MAAGRHLVAADLDAAADVLADAFAEDPMFAWIFDDPDRRPELVRAWMRIVAERGLAQGHAYVVDGAAVAAWAPPDVAFYDEASVGRLGEVLAGVGERAEAVTTALLELSARHPAEPPHFYLHAIGTTRASRGRGHGAALLRRVLATCDDEGLPAYLESSNPANVPFYEHHGFEVTGRVELEPGGPVVHLMWREPPA